MPRAVKAYVAVLSLCAVGLLYLVGLRIERSDWPYLVVLSAMWVFFVSRQLQLPSGIYFSFSGPIEILAIAVAGTPTAMWVLALGSAAYRLFLGTPSLRLLYNTSQVILSVFAAGQVFEWLGGKSGPEFDHPLPLLAAAIVYMVVDTLLISQLLVFLRRVSFWDAIRATTQSFVVLLTFLAGQLVAIVSSFLASRDPAVGLGLVAALLLSMHMAIRHYLQMAASATRHGEELEAMLDAAQSAILVTDGSGTVQHVNDVFVRLAGINTDKAEVRGRSLQDLQVAGQAGLMLTAGRSVATGPLGKVRTVLPVELGAVRYLDYYRGPVGQESAGTENPVGTIEVFTDITALKEAEERLRAAHEAMLRALTAAIDARDPYTHGHSERVAEFSRMIAAEFHESIDDVERVYYAALLHDIGKLGVDDRVLRKQGPLSAEERAAMMDHPVIGAQLLEKAGVFAHLLPGVRHHHEWYGGGGYPDGLQGSDIPFDARIVGVADAFDAMTSDRPYRRALSADEALRRLQEGVRSQFDPDVVRVFADLYATGRVAAVRQQEQSARVAPAAERNGAGVIRPVHKKELAVLYRVAREGYAALDLPAVLQRMLEVCADAMGPHDYVVFLSGDETRELAVAAAVGPNVVGLSLRVPQGDGVVGQVAATGKSILVTGTGQQSGEQTTLTGFRAECAVPLLHGHKVIGVFSVQSPRPGAFTPDDLYLFETLAQQVAGSVELTRYHQRLIRAATYDGLTGVLNHHAFYQELDQAVAAAQRLHQHLSLVILDLNGLKGINDTYGHLAGDRALQEWAALMRRTVRERDVVARYGGDEFAIIMPDTSRRQAEQVVERLVRASLRSFEVDGRIIHLPRASLGVACFPEDGDRPAELVAQADRLMYAEKGRSVAGVVAGPRFL